MKNLIRIILGILILVNGLACANRNEPNNLKEPQWDMMLMNRLMSRANALSEQARKKRTVHNVFNLVSYQASVRQHLKKILFDDEDIASFLNKPLKEKNIAQPIVTSMYKIYRIAFESVPDFYVTANLYVPNDVKFPVPGIVAVSDHALGGKAASYNQRLGIVFAAKGYVTLVIDFPDRGEMIGGNDHFINGTQMSATGLWPNYLFIINSMRAVDYLQSRTDIVDPARIAITGTSGGGMTSLVTAAYDNRIAAAVACCCVEPLKECLISGYTSCPEYLVPNGLSLPLEWSDIAALMVPRPLILLRAKKDSLFTQAGFDQTVGETAEFYRVNNTPDCFRAVETNEPHTYSAAMREAAYFWFSKWMGTPKGEILPEWKNRILEANDVHYSLSDSQIELESDSNLAVGIKSKTSLHSIAVDRANRFANARYAYPAKEFSKKDVTEIKNRVCRFYSPPADFANMKVHRINSVQDGNIIAETIYLEPSSGVVLPAKLIKSKNLKPKNTLLYLDEEGTDGLAKNGFDKLVSSGTVILSVDVSGMGKLYPRASEWDKYEWCDISRILSYSSWTMDISVPHLQIGDALAAVFFLRNYDGCKSVCLYIAGIGRAAPIALMVAAISDNVDGLIGINSLISYRNYVDEPLPDYNIMSISYGVLKEFDIPIVLAAVSDKLILWAEPVDATKKPVSKTVVERTYEIARRLVNKQEIFNSKATDYIEYIGKQLDP